MLQAELSEDGWTLFKGLIYLLFTEQIRQILRLILYVEFIKCYKKDKGYTGEVSRTLVDQCNRTLNALTMKR